MCITVAWSAGAEAFRVIMAYLAVIMACKADRQKPRLTREACELLCRQMSCKRP